jgi:hypothetical protein
MHARPLMINNQHAIELALSDMHSISCHPVEIVSLADGVFKWRQRRHSFDKCSTFTRYVSACGVIAIGRQKSGGCGAFYDHDQMRRMVQLLHQPSKARPG